jgi:beta-phosphoglucomutase-like phosphatase (HAD superfamily)
VEPDRRATEQRDPHAPAQAAADLRRGHEADLTATLNQLEDEQRRRDAIAEAKRLVATHTAHLTKAQDRLRQLEHQDFEARVASRPLSSLTVTERSELIRRKGLRAFEKLLQAEHAR